MAAPRERRPGRGGAHGACAVTTGRGATSEREALGRWRRGREQRAGGGAAFLAPLVLARSRTSGPRPPARPGVLPAWCPGAAAAHDELPDAECAGADEGDDPCPRF